MGAAVVCVTDDKDGLAQCWTRIYQRAGQFPQVVHSMKRFSGKTGLEEYIGYGIGMALRVYGEDQSLIFESCGYFLELFGKRLALPNAITPGKMRIIHKREGVGTFSFTLTLRHPYFGRLIYQRAMFKDDIT